ncbi:uncharacterized protein LOC143282097 isoform X2 [Babylonia areolata]
MKAARSSSRTLLLLVLVLCVCPVIVNGDAAADLTAVQEAFFQWNLQQSPVFSTEVGETAYNNRVADLSVQVLETQFAAVQEFINTTSAIDRSQLSRQHQYSYDVFMDTLTTFTSNYRWRNHGPLNPVNQMEVFYLYFNYIVGYTPFNTKQDFENFISRIRAWSAQVGQMMDRMNKAIQMGTTNHNVSMIPVPKQIETVRELTQQKNPLFKPFNETLETLASVSQADKDDLRSRAQSAWQELRAALGNLKTYIENTYMPHTRATYGVDGLPSGQDYYRACLQWHLSLDLSPEHVHRTGLREVDRITQLMRQVMTKQGFSGTISEYYNQLKADPRFQLGSAEEILKAYRDLISKIQTKLPALFKDIPPGRIEVKPMSFDGPYGMYQSGSEDGKRPGVFSVNLFRPNETRTFSMVSLTLHEAFPGHHMQAIYQLNTDLPKFQKFNDFSEMYDVPYKFPVFMVFSEGWGLYAEYLGEEMGVYANDYEMMGRYGDEIFRACRLVVDTGLHFMGWSREKAIRFLSERTPMYRAELEIEVDRYLTWPGQACAYKIGELKIKELRENATRELGSGFDLREFHSVLLSNGAVPLSVMETIVRDYIDRAKLTGAASRVQGVSGITVVLLALLASLVWPVSGGP